MRLDRLTVKGLFTFANAVTLDAATLPRGVVAIVGPNGEGKTGLIESALAVLHGEFPTRSKELADYTNQRDAYIEADYQLDAAYRARMNIDGHTRKRAATLSRKDEAGIYRPINDGGKVSTYSPAIAARFPSLSILLATAFAAQNRRGSFSDLKDGERKQLFQELLGHGQYIAWSAAAGDVVRAIERRRSMILPIVRRLELETGAHVGAALDDRTDRLDRDREAAAEDVDTTRAALVTAEAAVAAAAERLRAASARIAERATVAAQLVDARADAAASEGERALAHRDYAAAVRRLTAVADAAAASLARRLADVPTDADLDRATADRIKVVTTQTNADIADREQRIANNDDLLKRADAIRAAGAALDALVADREAAGLGHRAALAAVEGARDTVDAARRRIEALAHWPDVLATADRATDRVAALPFGAKCADAKCAFVADATAAIARRADAVAGIRQLDEADAAHDEARAALATAAAVVARADARVRDLDAAIAVHDRERTRDRVARLDTAATAVETYRKDIADMRARLAEAVAAAEAARVVAGHGAGNARAAILAEQGTLQTTFDADVLAAGVARDDRLRAIVARSDDLTARIADLDRRRADLDVEATADEAAAAALDTAEATRRQAAAAAGAAAIALAQLDRDRVAHVAAVEAFRRRRADKDAAAHALAQLDAELVDWIFLQTATSRDGLPTLEIDAAGPLVSERANDLLATCYGSNRFTVEIITQDARAKGGLKEVFEMKVWDSKDTRRARDIGDLSGGEKILVDEAVKCALALHVNDHNRVAIRTCFRDETTSALYPDTALRYMTMLRRVQAAGQFDHVFFVTHAPAVAAQADAQIRVEGGTLTVSYPPYAS